MVVVTACRPLYAPWGEAVIAPGEPIRIGVTTDRDAGAANAQPASDAAQHLNVAGHSIEVVPLPVRCRGQDPASSVPSPASPDGLVGIVAGGCSASCVYSESGLFDRHTTMVAYSCTAAAVVQQGFPTVFRLAWDDNDQALVAAVYAHSDLHARRAVLVRDTSVEGRSLARAFTGRFKAEGGAVSEVGVEPSGDLNVPAVARSVKADSPDVVFLALARPDAPRLLTELQAALAPLPVIATDTVLGSAPCAQDAIAPPSCRNTTQLPEGLIAVGLARQGGSWFSEAERGADSPTLFDAQQADAVRLYAAALSRVAKARPDGSLIIGRQSLRDALARSDLVGQTGRIRFDPAGERQRDVGAALYQVGDGRMTPLRLLRR